MTLSLTEAIYISVYTETIAKQDTIFTLILDLAVGAGIW